MNTYRQTNLKELVGKTVIFRGCGQVVEVEAVHNGTIHGIDLLTNGSKTGVDAEFVQDGIIVMEREEARQVFAVPLAMVEKFFSPEEEEAAEKEAVNV